MDARPARSTPACLQVPIATVPDTAAAAAGASSRVVSATNCGQMLALASSTAARLMVLLQCLIMTGVCVCSRPCNLMASQSVSPCRAQLSSIVCSTVTALLTRDALVMFIVNKIIS